jgi:phosphoglucomutase
MSNERFRTIETSPFSDQRPGTSGLRKKTRLFLQPHYIENFVQSIFNSVGESEGADFSKEMLVIGGDGRFYNRSAIRIILKIAVANDFGRILIGRAGHLSTPAMSAVIRRRSALGGILLTASHNPGGADADFGIKYNVRNGGPAPENLTEQIYKETREISRYRSVDLPEINLDYEGTTKIGNSEITIINPFADYLEILQAIFDFAALRGLFRKGFRLLFDAMHGITGPYASEIFEKLLQAPPDTVIRATPLEDFGGLHPDPNQVHAAGLVKRMALANAPDMGAACDGDGDRNMILGRNFFVTPGDSLAIIAEHARECIPGYGSGFSGVARSMPTSTAIDRVAREYGIACHETPTGWKYFGNLMDAGMCTICGEESFGTGSNHVREKDGIWAVLAWLSILSAKGGSVEKVVNDHWQRFGRSYYQRHDYEGLDAALAGQMMQDLHARTAALAGTAMASSRVLLADDFQYTDPVDGSVSVRQGIRILLEDGSRIVARLSGTGTEGATLRLYFERYRKSADEPIDTMLQPLMQAAQQLFHLQSRFRRDQPSVVT